MQKCACFSGLDFQQCCEPFLTGQAVPPGPEETMRSRYTAFSRGDWEYLKLSWHPETCPDSLGDEEPLGWVHLEIIEVAIDEEEGVEAEVEFIAKLIDGKKLETLHEVSQFEKIDGRWLYCSGEFKNESNVRRKISGSETCPCASGKIFKNCHG